MVIVADGVLVGDLAHIAPLALGQQVPQGLVVHLDVGGVQIILPPLLLQQLRLLQDLPRHSTQVGTTNEWVMSKMINACHPLESMHLAAASDLHLPSYACA